MSFDELECFLGPMDGELIRLKPGQTMVEVPSGSTVIVAGELLELVDFYRPGVVRLKIVSGDETTTRRLDALLHMGQGYRHAS